MKDKEFKKNIIMWLVLILIVFILFVLMPPIPTKNSNTTQHINTMQNINNMQNYSTNNFIKSIFNVYVLKEFILPFIPFVNTILLILILIKIKNN